MLNVYQIKFADVYEKCTVFMKKVVIKHVFKEMLIIVFKNVCHVLKKVKRK